MTVRILIGDVRDKLRELPDESVHCVVTSPPYFGLRDYGADGQIGLEETPTAYVETLVGVFREVRRVLRADGTLWLNLGDSYAGSWGAQGNRVTESDDPSWHSSQIKNHPKRAARIGSIREAGLKPKDLIGIPWRVAFALQADGWWLRQDIIWSKPNPMPESITDRCTKSHEYLFLMSKSPRYFFDNDAMREAAVGKTPHDLTGAGYAPPGQSPHHGNRKALRTDTESRHRSQIAGGQSLMAMPDGKRNRRSVWTIATQPFKEAHFATFPPALVEPCILAGSRHGGVILDPFGGSGTTALVADRLGRDAILIELNPTYADMARSRISGDAGMFSAVSSR